jgi:tRNA pseudouridine55 synthase
MRLPELLLIDKPRGMSSFGVIRVLRRKTGFRKFGHGGTLDPLATGLMLIGAGRGTKQLGTLLKLDKEYVATVRIGESRTTGDLEGAVITQQAVAGSFSPEKISATVAMLVGTHTLPVSAYSALKRDGVPLYKRARAAASRGETFTDVPMRAMTVHDALFLNQKSVHIDGLPMQELTIRFRVASGVYVRSLGEELGRRLGYPATLTALRRTQVGPYRVEQARTLGSWYWLYIKYPNAGKCAFGCIGLLMLLAFFVHAA